MMHKKIILSLLIIVTIFSITIPRPASAGSLSWPGMADIVAPIKLAWEKTEKGYDKIQGIVGAELSNRTVSMFMDTLAYNVASELATGGIGGKPLFRTLSTSGILEGAKNAALGEFLGELTEKGFEELGINLCAPSLSFKLTLVLGILDEERPPKLNKSCDWANLKNNWGNFKDNVQNDLLKLQLDRRSATVDDYKKVWSGLRSKGNTDLGTALKLKKYLNETQLAAEKAAEVSASECRGYIDKVTTITQEVKVGCTLIMKMSIEQWDAAVEASREQIESRKEKADNVRLSDIMKGAASKFTKTLSSKLMHAWIKGGTWSLFGQDDTIFDPNLSNEGLLAKLRGGADLYQPRGSDIFKDLKKVNIESVETYGFLDIFSICPSDKDYIKSDNCVMSPAFLQAVNSQMTVREAVENGVIEGSLAFISSTDDENNNTKNCYRNALCYRNLVKLRKANIIPVGWEMVAIRLGETKTTLTLQQAMDCFEESTSCEFERSAEYAVKGNDHNRFYHLVDPDWVLKAPEVLCDAYVSSQVLESSQTNVRQKYCADVKVCLQTDDDGNCLSKQYNYCTRSENIWRFNGDNCKNEGLYSGCLTFNNSDIGINSYIEDTLDYCTLDQVGCQRYSQNVDSNNDWYLEDIESDNNDLFLNSQSASCSEDRAGCSEYIVMATDTGVNLITNGSFNDLNGDDKPDGWQGWTDERSIIEYDGNRIANGYPWIDRNPKSPSIFLEDISLLPNTIYKLSADAGQYRSDLTDGDQARIIINTCDDLTCGDPPDGNTSFMIEGVGTCAIGTGGHDNAADLLFIPENDGKMHRKSCTFMTGPNVSSGKVTVIAFEPMETSIIWFDNLKLEVISNANSSNNSSFSDYGQGSTIYMDDAVMCVAEEVGCQGYTALNGDPMIPGVINQSDLCPAECVGYETFTEQTNIFDVIEDDTDVEYYNFIPGTAQSCPAQEIGCEEFTNLDIVVAGGEGREYYKYLRQCVPENLGTPYYTWEGTDVAGYQLKTWYILKTNDTDTDAIGAPCTNVVPGGETCQDGIMEPAICTDIINDPNCREFFDVDGNSFLRFQDRVIFASNDCQDYRRTLSGQEYKVLPDQSESCSDVNNNCRSYYGNQANNMRIVFADNFETTFRPWNLVEGTELPDLSSESLTNNGNSLESVISDGLSRDLSDLHLRNNQEYEFSWWMKSDEFISSSRLIIRGKNPESPYPDAYLLLQSGDDSNFENIEAGHWHQYTYSVFISQSDIDLENLENLQLLVLFEAPGNLGKSVYIDNFTLKETNNSFSVVRNSWNTPVSCDDPYQGYNLGCQAYVDTNNKGFNLKSFDYLCREEAIGCLPVIDTQNSSNPFMETFNLSDYSEFTVSADSIDYLVPDRANYCPQELKGCTALGKPDRLIADEFTTTYKLNDPDKYDQTLCQSENLGCEEYVASKGSYYFKDPGADTCSYQTNISINDTIYSGWFKTNTLADETPTGCSNNGGDFDEKDLDFLRDYCHEVDSPDEPLNFFTKDDCTAKGGQWEDYNLAAQCPASENLCTTFKDPSDPIKCDPKINGNLDGYCSNATIFSKQGCENDGEQWTPSCSSYYYYYNDSIDETSCNGEVDRQLGCVLFYENNNWNGEHTQVASSYDSAKTYQDVMISGNPASPVACNSNNPDACDSNKLIKVSKDRQCAEWLACKSSTATLDPDTNDPKIICDNLDTCIDLDPKASNKISQCKQWGSYDDTVEALTIEKYQARHSGVLDQMAWDDKEYLGYSIPNLISIGDLTIHNFGDIKDPDPRLVYAVYNAVDPNGRYHSSCVDNYNPTVPVDGTVCAINTLNTDGDYSFKGQCHQRICWINPRVNSVNGSDYNLETRGYALNNAPFPEAIRDNINYPQANICVQDDASNGCEETFKKVKYGQTEAFYYPEATSTPNGICSSGDLTNKDCSNNWDCDTYDSPESLISRKDGICSFKTQEILYKNWPGICLEYDAGIKLVKDGGNSYYCNQWYPAQKIKGTSSMYDNYKEAGYFNSTGQDALFCAISEPYELEEDRIYCGFKTTPPPNTEKPKCRVLYRVPAGAKVNIASENKSLLSSGYLKKDKYTFVPKVDAATPNSEKFPNQPADGTPPRTSFDRIERPGRSGGDNDYPDDMFQADDFEPVTDETVLSTFTIGNLKNLYDAEIEYFYLDERVDYSGGGGTNYNIWDNVYGYGKKWTTHLNNESANNWLFALEATDCSVGTSGFLRGSITERGELIDWVFRGSGGRDININVGNYHEVRISEGLDYTGCGLDNAEGVDTSLQSGSCRFIMCNPLNYNYYVKAERIDLDDSTISYNIHDYAFPNSGLENTVYTPNWNFNIDLYPLEDSEYKISASGTHCTGLECYQQCKVITQLDSEGDKSLVRTDLWWREEDTKTRTSFPGIEDWTSYYINNSDNSYIRNANVMYATIKSITDLTFTHFGAAMKTFNPTELIVTRMPILKEFALKPARSAVATFFQQWGEVVEGNVTLQAQDRLSYLFFKVSSFLWDKDTKTYTAYDDIDDLSAVMSNKQNPFAGPDFYPKIYAMRANSFYLTESVAQTGLAVNGQIRGEVIGQDGSLFAAVKIFYLAHPDHMPINSVDINWGDGSGYGLNSGKYKNALPEGYCDPNKNIPGLTSLGKLGFGGTKEACQEGYRSFYNNYQYDTSLAYACNGRDGKPNKPNASCYKPKVRVIDHWGQETEQKFDGWIVVYK